jgi:hypothetical protein
MGNPLKDQLGQRSSDAFPDISALPEIPDGMDDPPPMERLPDGGNLPDLTPEEIANYKKYMERQKGLAERDHLYDPNDATFQHKPLLDYMRYKDPKTGADVTDQALQRAIAYQDNYQLPSTAKMGKMSADDFIAFCHTHPNAKPGGNAIESFVTDYRQSPTNTPEIKPFEKPAAMDHDQDASGADGYSSTDDKAIHVNQDHLKDLSDATLAGVKQHELTHQQLQYGPGSSVPVDRAQAMMDELQAETKPTYREVNRHLGVMRANLSDAQDPKHRHPSANQVVKDLNSQMTKDYSWKEYMGDPREMEVRLSKLNETYFAMTGKMVKTPADSIRMLNYFGANMDQQTVDDIARAHPVEFGGKSVRVYPTSPDDRFNGTGIDPFGERYDMGQVIDCINDSHPSNIPPELDPRSDLGAQYKQTQQLYHRQFLEWAVMKSPGIAVNDAKQSTTQLAGTGRGADFVSPLRSVMGSCLSKGMGGAGTLKKPGNDEQSFAC